MLEANSHVDLRHLVDLADAWVATTAAQLTRDCRTDAEKAVAVYAFVRDEILFTLTPAPDRMKASEVLKQGAGSPVGKTLLFVALLLACNVQAKASIVEVEGHVLEGLLDPPVAIFEFGYAEILLGSQWLKVDSHVFDSDYLQNARLLVGQTDYQYGYGINKNEPYQWNGRADSLSLEVAMQSNRAKKFPRLVRRPHNGRRKGFAIFRNFTLPRQIVAANRLIEGIRSSNVENAA
jgi:transglutaminase-like putative cysteine protease